MIPHRSPFNFVEHGRQAVPRDSWNVPFLRREVAAATTPTIKTRYFAGAFRWNCCHSRGCVPLLAGIEGVQIVIPQCSPFNFVERGRQAVPRDSWNVPFLRREVAAATTPTLKPRYLAAAFRWNCCHSRWARAANG